MQSKKTIDQLGFWNRVRCLWRMQQPRLVTYKVRAKNAHRKQSGDIVLISQAKSILARI